MTLPEFLHWLATPISGASDHAIAMPLAWHGRLMVLAMGLLTPPLIIVARFFKVTPGQDWPRRLDNPFWFVTHRRWGHIVGVLVAVAMGFVLAERGLQLPLRNVHTATGWLVVFLVLVQLIGSWLRGSHGGPIDPFTRKPRPRELWPGDHYSMMGRRIVFEHVHKGAGYLLLVLTAFALCTGLIAADAPRWMPIVLGLWWIVMLAVFCLFAARRALHRHLPGHLGSRSGSSGQSPASGRTRHRALASNRCLPVSAGI